MTGKGASRSKVLVHLLAGVLLLALAWFLYHAHGDGTQWIKLHATLERWRTVSLSDGDERIKARFRYHLGKRSFVVTRDGVSNPALDPGYFLWRGEAERHPLSLLNPALTITVWVDSNHPTTVHFQSPAQNQEGLGGIGARFFATVGLFVLINVLLKVFSSSRRTLFRGRPPQLVYRSTAFSQSLSAWFLFLLWNVFSFPLYGGVAVFLSLELPERVDYWLLMAPLVSLLILGVALKRGWSLFRFGETPLTITTPRARTGAAFGGYVDLSLPERPAQPFTVTLSCLLLPAFIGGKGVVLWEDSQECVFQPGIHGGRMVFRFQLPPDLPGSGQGVGWQLAVRGAIKKRNFLRFFNPLVAGPPPWLAGPVRQALPAEKG